MNETRLCVQCDAPLPDDAVSYRKYCSAACRLAYWAEHGKAYRKAYEKARYAADPEGERARTARWRAANPGRGSATSAVWNKANPEKVKANVQAYRNGPAGVAWREANKDKLRAANRRWRQSHPEAVKARTERRRAMKKGAKSEPASFTYLHKRDGGICGICGKKVNLKIKYPDPKSPSVDHVVPYSLGGDDTRANKQLAHFLCNSLKNNRAVGEQLRLLG